MGLPSSDLKSIMAASCRLWNRCLRKASVLEAGETQSDAEKKASHMSGCNCWKWMCWMRWMRLQENKDITQVSLLAFEKNLTRPASPEKIDFVLL